MIIANRQAAKGELCHVRLFFVDIHEFTDQEKMATYREGVFASVEKYSGRYLVLGGKCEIVEGS